MRDPLRLRVHVSEPFDFERENESPDLFGLTIDHRDPEADEWLVHLEGGYMFREEHYHDLLLSPRYVGEHLSRVFDSILGLPVRIAHRVEEDGEHGWHFAMTGMISLAPPIPSEAEPPQDQEDKK